MAKRSGSWYSLRAVFSGLWARKDEGMTMAPTGVIGPDPRRTPSAVGASGRLRSPRLRALQTPTCTGGTLPQPFFDSPTIFRLRPTPTPDKARPLLRTHGSAGDAGSASAVKVRSWPSYVVGCFASRQPSEAPPRRAAQQLSAAASPRATASCCTRVTQPMVDAAFAASRLCCLCLRSAQPWCLLRADRSGARRFTLVHVNRSRRAAHEARHLS